MGSFTYENNNSDSGYEKYEWDNTWIEHANGSDAKRVLYIGDSISCQIRRHATALAKENVLFDGYGSSKGIDNPYLIDSIKLFAKQQGKCNAVLFNNGLHGWHLDDGSEYGLYYEGIVRFLLDEFKDIPILIILTTHVGDNEREKRIITRNSVAMEIAKKFKLQTIDLYSESLKLHDMLDEAGVHFADKGNKILAEKILDEVMKHLN